jgi:uncharacterized lipoprotein YddW (UPF0748 family)
LDILKQQVKLARDRSFAGVSFFFYESLWNFGSESVAARQSALKSFFPTSLKRPQIDTYSEK